MAKRRIGILGTGRLGSAMARGFAQSNDLELLLCNRSPEKSRALASELSHAASVTLSELASQAEIIVIAVKPAMLADVCRELAEALGSRQCVIVSVAVGPRVAEISQWLPKGVAVARAMPTIATAVCRGVTGIVAADIHAKSSAVELFNRVGVVLELADETAFDAVLALGASGLGFIAYLADGLVAGAEQVGLSTAEARLCAAEVLVGAGTLLRDTTSGPAELQAQVATPNGTTMAGLAELDKAGVREALISAIQAAVRRANELRGR